MLIYSPIEVLISVLYHYYILTTTISSRDESHDQSKPLTSSYFQVS